VDVRELQRIEASRVNLTLHTLLRLARAFGTPVRALFDPPASRRPEGRDGPRRRDVCGMAGGVSLLTG
jgi:transcriptional regulator with XRE-family HTH domain